jgi:hypothetical protein
VRQQPRNGTGTQAGHTPHDRNDERWRCRWCGGWREDDGDDRCRLAGTGRRRTATLAWAVAGLTMVALVAAVRLSLLVSAGLPATQGTTAADPGLALGFGP